MSQSIKSYVYLSIFGFVVDSPSTDVEEEFRQSLRDNGIQPDQR